MEETARKDGKRGKAEKWLAGKQALCQVVLLIIMVISKCYFSREHIALLYKKWCEHRIRKTNRLKPLRMMENHT